MVSALEDDISLENLLSYVDACRQVSTICEITNDGEYDFLLVPSRGAAPIVDMCRTYFISRREPWDARGGMETVVRSFLANPLSKALYLPFTADTGNLDVGVSPGGMRRFWCRVVGGMIRDPEHDPFSRFYARLRSLAAETHLEPHATMYEIARPCGDRFVFLDTAVSGQAICEIMDGFAEIGLNEILYIVVIDENGDKLRPEYRAKLLAAQANGVAHLVYVRRLFTEDRGPAVSGIWSVVFPELMQEALRLVPEFKDQECIGAGLYFWSVDQHLSAMDRFVDEAIAVRRSACMNAMMVATPDHGRLEDDLAMYRKLIRDHRLFRRNITLEIARPRLVGGLAVHPRDLDVSSSHVLRVSLTPDQAKAFIQDFQSTC